MKKVIDMSNLNIAAHPIDGENTLIVNGYEIKISYDDELDALLYRVYYNNEHVESFSSIQQAFGYIESIDITLLQCPHCKSLFSMDEDGYQMNDIFEIVFCSLECSHKHNLEHKDELLSQGYTENDLSELA